MAARAKAYINREVSWLAFNQRVLEEALDPTVPLLERAKFLAITSGNLDEFFMVRVGGLRSMVTAGRRSRDPTGRTAGQQLADIRAKAHGMLMQQYHCFLEELEPALAQAGIHRLRMREFSDAHRRFLRTLFTEQVYPVITPMAVHADQPFPLVRGLTLHMAVRLRPEAGGKTPRFAVFPLEPGLDRFVRLPGGDRCAYTMIEDVVRAFAADLFPGERVIECRVFRITRNADMSVQEDLAPDLLTGMLDVLNARKTSDCVRLEIEADSTRLMRAFLQRALRVADQETYAVPGPVDLKALFGLGGLPGMEGVEGLVYEPWPAQPSPDLDPHVSLFEVLRKQDLLLYHPYEDFQPVVRWIEEAADDPDVLAIKQILYRTSRNSPVVAALRRAAERGKHVTVIVELKARFDEAQNIEWARELERAGVQVVYGIKGLKTHAKVCIVLRREATGLRRYMHFGTGNYNEKTARLYSDVSYMTSNPDLGADASTFFNTITGYSQPQPYLLLDAAPHTLRDRLLELVEGETGRKRQGQQASITAKMNSLVDPRLIEALYQASQAGVKVRLNVRGICCLQPGLPGISENIEVISIIDRYLEHSRIYHFHHGGDHRLYISSADWMPRNLDRRIELLVPVVDNACKLRLLEILDVCFKDTVKARRLMPDGSHQLIKPAGRRRRLRSQEELFRLACERAEEARRRGTLVFEPHRPPKPRADPAPQSLS
jgi:polyphosphate kinase